jgi:tetratricopeptide (TPR) repeat protein
MDDLTPAAVVKDEAFYWQAAEAAFQEADFEKALRLYAKVLEFNPQNAAAWTSQVRMLIELQEYQEAKVWADKALERFPHEPELLAAKAVALGRLGDFKNAMAFSDAAVMERGDTPYIWLARGDIFLACKEKRAQYCFDKAVAYAPASWVIQWLVSRIYYFYGQFVLALKYIKAALDREAERSVIWLQMGHCQVALGLTHYAWNSYDQALQLDPTCWEAKQAMEHMVHADVWTRLYARLKSLFHS